MSFLKAQVSFPSSVASIVSAIKYNSSILYLAQKLYTLVKGSPLKCKFLRFSSARIKIHQSPHFNFEVTNHFLFQFCIFFIVMTNSSTVNFKLNIFNFGQKNPIKVPISPFLMLFSKPQVSFSSNFASLSCVMKDNSFVHF